MEFSICTEQSLLILFLPYSTFPNYMQASAICRVMSNIYPSDGIFNLHWTIIIDSFSSILHLSKLHANFSHMQSYATMLTSVWAASSEFVSSSIPSWHILTAHAQPLRGARDLAFCLKVLLDSLLVWASNGGSGETARIRGPCNFVENGIDINRKKLKINVWLHIDMIKLCLCWGLTSQSTIFQSYRDGATSSWVINQYFRGVKCLVQGHNTAAVGLEPPTSRSEVRHSTTEPPHSPIW